MSPDFPCRHSRLNIKGDGQRTQRNHKGYNHLYRPFLFQPLLYQPGNPGRIRRHRCTDGARMRQSSRRIRQCRITRTPRHATKKLRHIIKHLFIMSIAQDICHMRHIILVSHLIRLNFLV